MTLPGRDNVIRVCARLGAIVIAVARSSVAGASSGDDGRPRPENSPQEVRESGCRLIDEPTRPATQPSRRPVVGSGMGTTATYRRV